MSAKVKIVEHVFTVQYGTWTADGDSDQANAILGFLEARAKQLGNSPSIPDIDQFLAEDATNIGAQIIQHSDRPIDDSDDLMVYSDLSEPEPAAPTPAAGDDELLKLNELLEDPADDDGKGPVDVFKS